jgi:integrase
MEGRRGWRADGEVARGCRPGIPARRERPRAGREPSGGPQVTTATFHARGERRDALASVLGSSSARAENILSPPVWPSASDPDIRFLRVEEIEALLRAVPEDDVGRVERILYLTAATTGMRQGELLALRWMDVDWSAGRIRVRRSYVRGEFGTPKSKRSSRSIPLARRLAGDLDRLHQSSGYQGDGDLVFGHPHTGSPLDRSRLLKRFKAAVRRAGVREIRFHDLRHTFGTQMAAQGVPMRTLQEMLGHRDFKTTLIYADYAPNVREIEWVEAAFTTPAPGDYEVELAP